MEYSSLQSPSSSRTSSHPSSYLSRASSQPSGAVSSNPSRASTVPPPLPVSSPPGHPPSDEEVVGPGPSIDERSEESRSEDGLAAGNNDLLYTKTEDVYVKKVPTLPSVRELATKFQPKYSPEPKPRKSLSKVSHVTRDNLNGRVGQQE